MRIVSQGGFVRTEPGKKVGEIFKFWLARTDKGENDDVERAWEGEQSEQKCGII